MLSCGIMPANIPDSSQIYVCVQEQNLKVLGHVNHGKFPSSENSSIFEHDGYRSSLHNSHL